MGELGAVPCLLTLSERAFVDVTRRIALQPSKPSVFSAKLLSVSESEKLDISFLNQLFPQSDAEGFLSD